MSRFFVHLAYRGSKYRGWQWQPNVSNTVQGFLESTFETIFKQKTTLYGCGRTDAEVHASQYFMHFEIENQDDFVLNKLKDRLNFMLPFDIAIYDIFKVEKNHHARFDASARTYRYHIHFKKNPFLRFSSSLYPNYFYDIEKMKEVVQFYATQKDFRAMCKKPDQYKHTLCRIDSVSLKYNEKKDDLLFEITANRFLQGMIRQLVGRMLDVGRGNLSFKDLKECFKTGEKPKNTIPAYPQGLYLYKIEYPFFEIEQKDYFL
ncbi:MAG: tRNA pseudouridine(38-40) synthase TruA [Chitinophagales bacterium]